MPTPLWASWLCPLHVGKGLRDLPSLQAVGRLMGTERGRARPETDLRTRPPARGLWGWGWAGQSCLAAVCHTSPEGLLLPVAVATPTHCGGAGGSHLCPQPLHERAPHPPGSSLKKGWR